MTLSLITPGVNEPVVQRVSAPRGGAVRRGGLTCAHLPVGVTWPRFPVGVTWPPVAAAGP